jgi:hypothetical protein
MRNILMTFLIVLISLPVLAQTEQLLVGLAGIDMEPKVGIPLAGYGSSKRRLPEVIDWRNRHSESVLFRPSEGIHSPIRAKSMVLKRGERYLVFISLDTIGLEDAFLKDIAKGLKKYGIEEKDILATATHTHGGPGTLSRRLPLELVAVDFFKRKNYDHILSKVLQNVEEALSNLEPAMLYKTSALIEDVQKNKFRKKEENHFDNKASFLVAKSLRNNQWLGGIVNFAIHGGTMPIEILHYSSDINGAIEKELEKLLAVKNGMSEKAPVFLFMNGAEGDVGSKGDRGVAIIDELAKLFIAQSAPALNNLRPVSPEFFITKKKVYLGLPGKGLGKCADGMFKQLPGHIKVNIWPYLPSYSFISLAQVGDITILSWPGEPSTQLGYNLKELARLKGATDPWIFALANDYATYFTTKDEFYEGEYDSCSSFYDYKGGQRILKAHSKLLERSNQY